MTSTERGLLIPRVDLDDATTASPVTAPVAEGLLIYNETGTEPHGFYYWDGSVWVRLEDSAFGVQAWYYTSSTTLLKSNDTEESTSNTDWTLIKEIRVPIGLSTTSTFSVYFEGKRIAGTYAYFQIYRNGVPVGTERYTTSTTYVSWTEDINGVKPGDFLQIYGYATVAGYSVWVRNFRIRGTLHQETVNLQSLPSW